MSITAQVTSGWRFDHWEGDALGTSTTTTVTMYGDRAVVAVFEWDIPPECVDDACCDDRNLCTVDQYIAGECVYTDVVCDEGKTCDPLTGECEHTQEDDYFEAERAAGNLWFYDPDGDHYSDHPPYFPLVTTEPQGAIVYKSILAEWSPDSPLTVIQNGELDRPVGSVHRDFSFTAPSTPGVYRIRMAATWAYEAIQSFYGDGPKGDAWNPGVGDYTEVEIEVD